LLPFVPLAIFIWGGLGLFNPMLWVVAGITAIATALWLPHVWTRTVITPEHAALPDLSATAAHTSTVDPADHFAWITSESGIAQSDAENAR
jgi:fatty acid desaturase